MEACQRCLERRGLRRDATVEYEGTKYCTTCEREWISARRHGEEALLNLPGLLRAGIKVKGWKFKEIADFIGVSEVVFGRYLKTDGESTRPGLENFVALCHAAGLLPNDLLGFTDRRLTEAKAEAEKWRTVVAKMSDVLTSAGVHLGDKLAMDLREAPRRERDPHAAELADAERAEATY